MRVRDRLVHLDNLVLGPPRPLPSLRSIHRALVIGVAGTVAAIVVGAVYGDWMQVSTCVFIGALGVLEVLRERRLVLRRMR